MVSLRERKLVATVGAGSDPRTFFWDEDRQLALLPSDGPPVEKGETRKGELRVLRAGELVATIEVAGQPHFVRTAGSRAYVAGRDAISVVSLDDMRVAGEVRVEKAEETTEIVFSPDKKRAFALFRESSRLSVLDLEGPRLVGSVTTGRGGVKFAKTLGAAALSAAATTASYYQGQSVAQTQGQRYFTYSIYTFGVATPQTSVVVRPDGEFAYALNTQTNDVTVVDASRATVVSKEPAKGRSLALLTGGAKIAVLGEDELRLIDTRAHRAGEPLPFQDSGGVRLLFTPDGQTAVAYGGKDLYLLDGQTGAVRARVAGLMSVSAVMFGGATAEKP